MFKVDVSRMAAPNTLQKQWLGLLHQVTDETNPFVPPKGSGRVSNPSLCFVPSEVGKMSVNLFKNRL